MSPIGELASPAFKTKELAYGRIKEVVNLNKPKKRSLYEVLISSGYPEDKSKIILKEINILFKKLSKELEISEFKKGLASLNPDDAEAVTEFFKNLRIKHRYSKEEMSLSDILQAYRADFQRLFKLFYTCFDSNDAEDIFSVIEKAAKVSPGEARRAIKVIQGLLSCAPTGHFLYLLLTSFGFESFGISIPQHAFVVLDPYSHSWIFLDLGRGLREDFIENVEFKYYQEVRPNVFVLKEKEDIPKLNEELYEKLYNYRSFYLHPKYGVILLIHANSAYWYFQYGKYEQCIKHYQELIKLDSNSVILSEAYFNMGQSFHHLSNLEQAEENFKKAKFVYGSILQEIEKSSLIADIYKLPVIYFNLGLCSYYLKEEAQAVEFFKQAIALDPGSHYTSIHNVPEELKTEVARLPEENQPLAEERCLVVRLPERIKEREREKDKGEERKHKEDARSKERPWRESFILANAPSEETIACCYLGGIVQYTGDNHISAFHRDFMSVLKPIKKIAPLLKENNHNAIKIYLPPNNPNAADFCQLRDFIKDLYRDYGIKTYILHFAGLYANPEGDFLLNHPTPQNLDRLKGLIGEFASWVRDLGLACAGVQLGNENDYYVPGAGILDGIIDSKNGPWDTVNLDAREYHKLMNELASVYKEKDPTHSVFLGHGGFASWQIDLIKPHLSNFDGIALSLYPNWEKGRPAKTVMSVEELQEGFTRHIEVALQLNKPIVISEFGESAYGQLGREGQARFAKSALEVLSRYVAGRTDWGVQALFWNAFFPEKWKDENEVSESELALFEPVLSGEFKPKQAFWELSRAYEKISKRLERTPPIRGPTEAHQSRNPKRHNVVGRIKTGLICFLLIFFHLFGFVTKTGATQVGNVITSTPIAESVVMGDRGDCVFSGHTEVGTSSSDEGYEEEGEDNDYAYRNHHLKLKHQVSERLSYDMGSFIYDKDYKSKDSLDNVSRIFNTKWSLYPGKPENDSLRFVGNLKYKEKRYKNTPTSGYDQIVVSPQLTFKKKDLYTINLGAGMNSHDYIESNVKDQFKVFGEIGVKRYFLAKKLLLLSSGKIETTKQKKANREKVMHDITGGFDYIFGFPGLYKISARGRWAERDSKEEEEQDEDYDYGYEQYYAKTIHKITPGLKTDLKYQYFKKDYVAKDLDHSGFYVKNTWEYRIFDDKWKRIVLNLFGQHKKVEYFLMTNMTNKNYRKETAEARVTYQRKKNWKASLSLQGNFYDYNRPSNNKKRYYALVSGKKLFLQGDLAVSLDFKYRYTVYKQKADSEQKGTRIAFRYKF